MPPKGTRWAGIVPGARPNWPHVEPISALAESQTSSYGAVKILMVQCPADTLMVRCSAETLTVYCDPSALVVRAEE